MATESSIDPEIASPTVALNPEQSNNDENVDEQADAQLTKRSSEFTSENYKLEISNLPSHLKYHVVKQMLERHFKLTPHKIRVGDKRAYVAFVSTEERDAAISKIDKHNWKGRVLNAKPADPRYDPMIKKQRLEVAAGKEADNGDEPEQVVTDDDLNSQVCPLWNKPYDEQLKIKDSIMRSVLNMSKQILKLSPSLKKDAPILYQWVQDNSKICCQFDGVEPSPSLTGYRNKCEFNVGRDSVIGFRMGRYKNGSERVVRPPANCPIVNSNMLQIVEALQKFLDDKDKTKLRGFDHVRHHGNIRQITLRSNEKNECLVIIDMHPQDLTQVELDEEIESVKVILQMVEQVVSIYFNISEKNHLSNNDQTLKLVYGQGHLYEYLSIDPECPLKFRIGPTSFFQVNTKAAEILYRSIVELAQLNEKSLVLDVGCGTGTIGLSLAKRVSYVIGIEIVESAIEDAKKNAQENSISNVTFFAGKAEELIGESIAILKGKLADQGNQGDIVAIVDPPRIGFNNSFVKTLRASNVKKIIYVACDAKANTNLLSLCRPKSKAYQGDPFVPVRAKAFDLFPHTKFCELVLIYERLTDTTKARQTSQDVSSQDVGSS